MQYVTLREWDDAPQFTSQFKLVTKLTDLGSPLGSKSVSGFYINMITKHMSDTNSLTPYGFNMVISYRQKETDNWIHLCSFNHIISYYVSDAASTQARQNPGQFHFERKFDNPIGNIKHIQLQVEGKYMRGDMGINDFGLVYRTKRETSVTKLEDE